METTSTQVQKQDEIIPTFAVSAEEAKVRFKELEDFIKSQMKKDEDYGVIPGCPKPSLFKPGAEKLATLYGLAPTIQIVESIKDWEKGFFHYQVKCSLVSKRTGNIIAEGVGSCNSRENKYKRQDGYTIDNTILKMAKKRALVDAVLTATRTSGLFTQDIEDLGEINKKINKSIDVEPIEQKKDYSNLIKAEYNRIGKDDFAMILKSCGFATTKDIKTSKDAEKLLTAIITTCPIQDEVQK